MKRIIGVIQGRLTNSPELMFFPADTWEEEFASAREIGFDAIEWGFPKKDYEKNPIMTDAGIVAVKFLMEKHKIKVPSICAYYFIESDFSKGDSKDAVNMLNTLIERGSKIWVERILIPFLGNSEIKNEEQKERIIVNLKKCLAVAEKHGVDLAFETSLPAEELKYFIERFGSKFVKVYYDMGNMTTYVGDKIQNEIKTLGNLISGVHIKDRKFKNTSSYPLGKGDVDFDVVFKTLKEISFKGPFIFEAARIPGVDDKALCSDYLKFIKEKLQKSYA